MHDIRQSLPQTDQTNPAKFPPYEYREYPKMMLDPKGKPYLNANKSCVVVHDLDEEKEFKAKIVATSVPASGATGATIASLANESEELAKLRAELAALKAAPVEAPKKRGRPAKVKVELPADLD